MNKRGIDIPAVQMGRFTSDDVFDDPNEQQIFDFYERSKDRYKRALDIGANVGIHSVLMAKNGWDVKAFEPDPLHFEILQENIKRNGCEVECHNEAVTTHNNKCHFIRVLGNTMGSHICGSKDDVYGDIEHISVNAVDCRSLFEWADFAKIDCEGHEAEILKCVTRGNMSYMDMMVEVGNAKNAEAIFDHFRNMDIAIYSQKNGWKLVEFLNQMPMSHHEGNIFIGATFQ